MTGFTVLALEADVLTVELADGPARFHAIWLRDNARDDASRDASNDQRLFDVSELPDEVAILAAEVVDGHLRVEFAPDGAVSTFDVGWLEAHRYDGGGCRSQGAVPWLAAGFDPHRLAWSRQDDPAARSVATTALVRDGLAIVDGLAGGSDGVGPSISDVAGIWGPVRETSYGEVFHVRAEADPVNLAFTPRALNVHTDNPYRRPVPGFQLLHCLVASGTGGVTVLVDGFRAAESLRVDDQAAFDMLAGHRVPFFASWPGVIKPGSKCARTTAHVDLFATCAEIAGVTLPDNAAEDSFSWLPLFRGGDWAKPRPPVINHSAGGMFALRNGKWKLVAGNGSGGREAPKGKPFAKPYRLFDLSSDLGERKDLAQAKPELVGRLTAQLEDIRIRGRSR